MYLSRLGGDNQLTFGIYGQSDQTTQATITLQAGIMTMTVQIDPLTGAVSIQRGGC